MKEGKRQAGVPGRRVRAVLESLAVPWRRGRKMIASTEDYCRSGPGDPRGDGASKLGRAPYLFCVNVTLSRMAKLR